jgi:hypothetical protein
MIARRLPLRRCFFAGPWFGERRTGRALIASQVVRFTGRCEDGRSLRDAMVPEFTLTRFDPSIELSCSAPPRATGLAAEGY